MTNALSEHEMTWDRVKTRLRRELGDQVFSSWFGGVAFEGLDDGTVRLSVPTRFLKSWIQQNYRSQLFDQWGEEVEDLRRVEVEVRGSIVQQPKVSIGNRPQLLASAAGLPAPQGQIYVEAQPQPRALPTEPPAEDSLGSPLDKRYTFGSFVVGRSNELAHKAAVRVASAKEPISFNPLFVTANVGLGKTHLLHAIANGARAAGKRVLYLTAERFMYGFVAALKAQSAIAFKEQLRGIDILLIDDLQFLHGKHMQAEFGHTLNALLDGSRQVVVAADRPPCDLETLDERLQSRLGGGLVVEVGSPDEELRLKILRAKHDVARERYPALDIPDAVMRYVAAAVQSSGRDLDGAFTRLVAHNQLTHAPLTVEMAEECLKDLIRTREPKRVKIEDIQRLVAKHYGVSRQDMVSARRTHNVVMPRQVAMYLSKTLTPRSLPEIGRRFGGRDHTTVLHAVRKIEGLLGKDEALRADIDQVRRMLLEV